MPGQPLTGSQEEAASSLPVDGHLLDQVITRGQSLVRIVTKGERQNLLLVHPVLYNATGRAEGMLLIEVAMEPLIEVSLQGIPEAAQYISVSGPEGVVWTSTGGARSRTVSVSVPVDVFSREPGGGPELFLTVEESLRSVYDSLNTLTIAYLGIGLVVLFLAGILAQYIGDELTMPLLSLTEKARLLAGQDLRQAEEPEKTDDEIIQLSRAFDTMVARVEERTRELEREVSERTRAESEATRVAEVRNVLLREVNHRVKNNLVAIISMLHQEEDLAIRAGKPDYVERLQEVVWRVTGLLTVHRLLSMSEGAPLALSQLCENSIRETVKGLPAGQHLHIQVAPSPVHVNSDQAHCLAMVLNELTTNTMKYAFGGRDQALISISIAGPSDGTVQLVYLDDGPGLPPAILQGDFSQSGIGFPLIYGLVQRSLGGTITLINHQGVRAHITFPDMNTRPGGQEALS